MTANYFNVNTSHTSRLTAGLLLVTLTACSGGGGGAGESGGSTAQFFDSLVEGLEYSSSHASGQTDSNGNFSYKAGQQTTFKVGDITLGSLTPSSRVSPIELVGGAAVLDDSPKILNIARFLQTIDEDNDPADGIQISAETRAAALGHSIDFDQETDAWESDPDVLSTIAALTTNPLVPEGAARQHFLAWISAARAGEYAGTWTEGLIGGNPRLSVSNAGALILIANYEDDDFGGSGSIDGSNGQFSVSTEYADFTGVIFDTEVTGTFIGTGDFDGLSGTFSGSLTNQAMAFLDPDLIDHYSDLDGETIGGHVYDDGEVLVAVFDMFMAGDSNGLYDVSMTVYMMTGEIHTASFYATSMTAEAIQFRGLSTSGEGFTGELSSTGDVSGDYYNLFSREPGGTFEGNTD